ncbi:MAG TPA: hypothetical protein VI248_05570 [Kineosporiaceae bacterium]
MSGGKDPFDTSTVLVRDVAVVSLIGGLGAHTVPVCRTAVEEALASAPVGLVLDLRRTVYAPESVAVLGMLRRYLARRGTPLWLAGAAPRLQGELRRTGVLDCYQVTPTVAAAIRAAALVVPDDGRRRGVIG